jgi:hypothetical protein
MRFLGQDLEPSVIADRLRAEGTPDKSVFVLCECDRRELLVDFLRQAGLREDECTRTHDGKLQILLSPTYINDDEMIPMLERLRGFRVSVTSVVAVHHDRENGTLSS